MDAPSAGYNLRIFTLLKDLLTGKKKISLSSAPLFSSMLVIFSLTLFIGVFWMVNEYQAYQESIKNIRSNYSSQYQDRLKEEHTKVVDFIEYKRSQTDLLIESEIRDKVQSAYSIASHIYRFYKDQKDTEELMAMIGEILRPIRWNNNKGYYFAGTMDQANFLLFSDDPWFEGKTRETVNSTVGGDLLGEIQAIVKDKGAGILYFDLVKPSFPDKKHSQVAFVKYFEPFKWFIGAAVYTQTTEEFVQQDIISRVQSMHFGHDGEIFGFRKDGTIFTNPDQRLIGRSVETLVDSQDHTFGKAMLSTALSEQAEGMVTFQPGEPGITGGSQKLSFIKAYSDWDWVFGTSLSMEEMEKAIESETKLYRLIAFRNVSMFITMFVIAVCFLLFFSYFYSLKIKQGIHRFTEFFREAADSNEKMSTEDLAFAEFEDLSELANHMVDDRIHKELLLRRDELRLDTLLALGSMEKESIEKKYDFILQAIVRITRSQAGYLALVNDNQSHISICSYVKGEEIIDLTSSQGKSRPVLVGGLPGAAVMYGRHIICNDFQTNGFSTYPYEEKVIRYIDVPIKSGGKIVVVAGVCNNSEHYDTHDARQVKMLLEGMWMHVLKTCSEKEMERLERQVIAVGEQERSAIGRDLHDDLGSHLSGVELLSKVLHQKLEKDDPEKAEQLGTIRDLIRDAIDKTRRLAQGLYPAHVIEHGLEAAVDELSIEVENLFKAKCNYSFDGDLSWVDSSVASHVYYIVRESVFNAARHGRSENIDIIMRSDRTEFSLQIGDDGKGFDQSKTHKGLGLHTMQYRAKAIGGSLEVISQVNQGTTVMLSGEIRL